MQKKPIVMLVGHGKVSGQKTTIEPGKHTIIFLGQVGEAFCLTAHNLMVANFVNADIEDKLFNELEKLIGLPSTSIINLPHKKPLSLPSQIQYEEINLLELELKKFQIEATSSSQGWIAYEHKIAPALELLNSASALRPMDIGYLRFNLIYSSIQPLDYTLAICFNKQKLETQIKSFPDQKKIKTSISNNNFIYITPIATSNTEIQIGLSKILEAIPKINILAIKIQDPQQSYSIIEMIGAVLDTDRLIVSKFQEVTNIYATNGQKVSNDYELYIPDNANIIWGGCRELDESF